MFLCLFPWQCAGFQHLCVSLVLSCVLTARGGIFPSVVTSDPHGHFLKVSQFTSSRGDRLTLAQHGNYASWDAIRQGTLSLSQLHHANRRDYLSFPQVSWPFPCSPSIVHSHQFQQLPVTFCPHLHLLSGTWYLTVCGTSSGCQGQPLTFSGRLFSLGWEGEARSPSSQKPTSTHFKSILGPKEDNMLLEDEIILLVLS